jgi:methyl-accepting chemotaxis protein
MAMAASEHEGDKVELATLQQVKKESEEYKRTYEEVVALVKGQQIDEAINISLTKSNHKAEQMIKEIRGVIKHKEHEIDQDAADAVATAKSATLLMLGVAVVALVVAVAIGIFIARMISGSLLRAEDVLRDLAEGEGDLTMRLPPASTDEIGHMARAFNIFMDKLHVIIAQTVQAGESVTTAS